MEIQILPIDNVQAPAVIELILNIQQKEFNIDIQLADQPDLLTIRDFYYANGGGFWGAFSQGELVGTIALIKFDKDAGAIRKMFVKKAFRGKELGIAQRLLETLINYSKANGLQHLYLGTISILEAALRFYERNGFEQFPKVSLPKTFPLMAADNVFCHLDLTQQP